jgi:hypothetical protein
MTVERFATDDCRRFRDREYLAGDLYQSELPVVHTVRGAEPVPIGVYPVVSDDDDSSQGWRPRVKSIRVE